VSVRSGEGLDRLKDEIKRLVLGDQTLELSESVLLSDRRHYQSLYRCKECLDNFILNMQAEASPEILALDLREAIAQLGEITGESTPDDVLDRIFSKFCIGK